MAGIFFSPFLRSPWPRTNENTAESFYEKFHFSFAIFLFATSRKNMHFVTFVVLTCLLKIMFSEHFHGFFFFFNIKGIKCNDQNVIQPRVSAWPEMSMVLFNLKLIE